MALDNLAAGTPTIRAILEVKDPDAASGDLLENYIAVPGVNSITLPAEESPTNDVTLLEGVASAAGFAGTGTIAVPLGTLLIAHPAHKLFASKRRDGGSVQVNIKTAVVDARGSIPDAFTVAAGDLGLAVIESGEEAEVTRAIRRGQQFDISGSTYTVVELNEDTSVDGQVASFQFTPEVGSAIASPAPLALKMPRAEWLGVFCKVTQFSEGDIQPSGLLSGQLTLTPETAVSFANASVADL